MKSRTTTPFEPVVPTDLLALVPAFERSHKQFGGLITRASGLATSRVKIVSPFNARAKYNLYAAFRIVLAHTRRHLWQARAAKNFD